MKRIIEINATDFVILRKEVFKNVANTKKLLNMSCVLLPNEFNQLKK